MARFEIVLCSQYLEDNFKETIMYTINDCHNFYIDIRAKIEPVKIALSTNNI